MYFYYNSRWHNYRILWWLLPRLSPHCLLVLTNLRLVSVSQCLQVSVSLCLQVSVSLHHLWLQVLASLLLYHQVSVNLPLPNQVSTRPSRVSVNPASQTRVSVYPQVSVNLLVLHLASRPRASLMPGIHGARKLGHPHGRHHGRSLPRMHHNGSSHHRHLQLHPSLPTYSNRISLHRGSIRCLRKT